MESRQGNQDAWLVMLAVNLAAYATGAFANLWDVLFDPLLVMLALIIVGRRVVTRVIASRIR